MSGTVPDFAAMVNDPLALADILPTCVPARLRCEGTIAFTMSPVLKPCLGCFSLGSVRGKPYLFIRHICLHPCPLAVMSSGYTLSTCIVSGVLLPTQAASI